MSKVKELQINGTDEDIWLYNSTGDINTPNRLEITSGGTTYYAGLAPVSTATGYDSRVVSSFRLTVGGTEYVALKRGKRTYSSYTRDTDLTLDWSSQPLTHLYIHSLEVVSGGQGGHGGGGGGSGGDGGLLTNGGGGGGGRGGAGGIKGTKNTYSNLTFTGVSSLTFTIGKGGSGGDGGIQGLQVDGGGDGNPGGAGETGSAGGTSTLAVSHGSTTNYTAVCGVGYGSLASGGAGETMYANDGGEGGGAQTYFTLTSLNGGAGVDGSGHTGGAGGSGGSGEGGHTINGVLVATGGAGGAGGRGGNELWDGDNGWGVAGSPGWVGSVGGIYILFEGWQ